jgi:hypothetical protein
MSCVCMCVRVCTCVYLCVCACVRVCLWRVCREGVGVERTKDAVKLKGCFVASSWMDA